MKRFGAAVQGGRAQISSVNGAIKFFAGDNVGMGRDHTGFALETGAVKFITKLDDQTRVVPGSAETRPAK